MKRAVFLDRDGTLIEEAGYLDRLERLVFFPYSVDAVRLLNRGRLRRDRGRHQPGRHRPRHRSTNRSSARRTAHIAATARGGRRARSTAFYYCPHHPDGVGRAVSHGRATAASRSRACSRRAAADLGSRSLALVRRRRSLARRRGGAGRRRARRAGAHRLRPTEAARAAATAPRRDRRQPDRTPPPGFCRQP